ncbi:hypothetical protein Pla52o_26090 [Novipirellula galeiformis]|uniref:Uncharacterized protein n=1 Tax=Novipirellula galeiformis TaxID=2528004 RepID=A0A5C6CG83_9BACT|nr:hypothetical protein Pla52o_26090 [Novipirellula galeiformis]
MRWGHVSDPTLSSAKAPRHPLSLIRTAADKGVRRKEFAHGGSYAVLTFSFR